MSNIYNMADTWNAAGTTFTAILMNVTDGAGGAPVSAAGSLLMDLQIAAASKFSVSKGGVLKLLNDGTLTYSATGILGNPGFTFNSSLAFARVTAYGLASTNLFGGFGDMGYAQTGVFVGSAGVLGFSSSTVGSGSLDLFLTRKAANILSVDKTAAGDGLGGIAPQVKAGAFVAADFPSGSWGVGRDTSGSTTKVYYNNGGVLMAVALS